MRLRTGNPYHHQSGAEFGIIEWVTPAFVRVPTEYGPIAHELVLSAVERAFDLILSGPSAQGYINTSLRPGGSMFVAVMLDRDQWGKGSEAAKLVRAVGESREYRLGDATIDREILRVLGFMTTQEKHEFGLPIPASCVPYNCYTDGPLKRT